MPEYEVYQHVHVDHDIVLNVTADNEEMALGLGLQKFAKISDTAFNRMVAVNAEMGDVKVREINAEKKGG